MAIEPNRIDIPPIDSIIRTANIRTHGGRNIIVYEKTSSTYVSPIQRFFEVGIGETGTNLIPDNDHIRCLWPVFTVPVRCFVATTRH